MSLGYASRLSYREDLGGQLGSREYRETPQRLEDKIDQLTELIRQSRQTVVFTGAGISTSCGIPDFRGPKGIWTLQRDGKELPAMETSFAFAIPSLTHQALKQLLMDGMIDFIVSQNVDGLHQRSGVPPEKLAELHGNCFSEKCSVCSRVYLRDFEMASVGFQLTGRRCVSDGCVGRLKDNILDWEDPLPDAELKQSEEISSSATLALCLGTSLQITPACNIPLKTVRSGGKMVIVNLQKTPKDKKAFLVIRDEADKVMKGVMERLQLKIPRFLRTDRWIILHRQGSPSRSGLSPIAIEVISHHGFLCPLPAVHSVWLSIRTGTEASPLDQPAAMTDSARMHLGQRVDISCCINFVDGLHKQSVKSDYSFEPLEKDVYQAYLQNGHLARHSALQTKSSSRLPVMNFKEVDCVTQGVDYTSALRR